MYEPNSEFPFSNISLTNPTAMQGGGAYFAKMTIEGKPIRIQLPKTLTKAGVVSTKRDCYIDLMYTREMEPVLIKWIDSIEQRCKELVNEKKSLWFSNELSKSDIDGMLTPLSRTYKGETMTLIRVAIDTSKRSGSTNCQIYDDKESKIDDVEFITTEHSIIPLVFIEGIKFTNKSIEIELKMVQMMVFTPSANECLINYKKPHVTIAVQKPTEDNKIVSDNADKINIPDLNNVDKCPSEVDICLKDIPLGEISELPENDKFAKLREIDITIANSTQSIILKEPTELYREMYKAAKEKLRKLKEESFLAFLEAKQIKTKYMIDDTDENDELPLI